MGETMATRIATLFGLGRAPLAPGTVASLPAIPLVWGLHAVGGFALVAVATLLVLALGWWAVGAHLEAERDRDPPEVVIDELAGMMLALWPLSLGLSLTGAAGSVWPWPGWVTGFLLFRFFDILKPPPVRWADRLPGATGVMLDDLLAGLMAAALATLAAAVAHGWA